VHRPPPAVRATGNSPRWAGWEVPLDGFHQRGLLPGQGLAQAAEVVLVAALLEVIGQRNLDRDGGGQAGRQLLPHDPSAAAGVGRGPTLGGQLPARVERSAVHAPPVDLQNNVDTGT
jgi:hypothetical protein